MLLKSLSLYFVACMKSPKLITASNSFVLFIFSINSSSEFISLVSKLYSANVFADVLINFSFNSLFSSSIFPAINPLSPSSSKPSEIGEPGYTIFFPT